MSPTEVPSSSPSVISGPYGSTKQQPISAPTAVPTDSPTSAPTFVSTVGAYPCARDSPPLQVLSDIYVKSLDISTGAYTTVWTMSRTSITPSYTNLNGADIIFKKSYNVTVSSNAFSGTLETDADLTLEPFDEEDYNLTFKTTGKVESLTDQKLTVSGRTATLSGFDHSVTRAAASLGSTPLNTFMKITLPLILPGVISGGLFAFVTSFDEVVVVLFLAGLENTTIPIQMWTGLREQLSPTILAVATCLIILSTLILVTAELLRRRSERLRGINR